MNKDTDNILADALGELRTRPLQYIGGAVFIFAIIGALIVVVNLL